MSSFYGQVCGDMSQTNASRRAKGEISSSVQSWKGSVINRLYYINDDLMIEVQYNEGSSFYGNTIFNGTVEEFIRRLK